jgi:hypothetical protein
MPNAHRDPARLLLAASVLMLLANGATLAWDYSQHSVQMDLSAYYAAGESLRLGLDPYQNNYPTVVTGSDFVRYSGFLYPPLTGLAFEALAALPYYKFKMLWDFSQLLWALAVGAVLLAWLRRSGPAPAALHGVTLFFMAMSVAFPLRVEMERGQVDLMLLLLVLSGLALIEIFGHGVIGGFLLGLTPLLKLHALYLLPFLLLRRRYAAFVASAVSLLVIAGVHLTVIPALSKTYVFEVLPRMDGNAAAQPAAWVAAIPDFPRPTWDQTVERSGRTYFRAGFDGELTVSNASLARQLYNDIPWLQRAGRSRLSMVIFAGLFLLVFRVTSAPSRHWSGQTVLAFWILAMGVVLLSAPLTWTMATIVLLPAAALVPAWLDDHAWPQRGRITALLVLGLLLVVFDERPLYHEVDRNVSALPARILHFAGVFLIRVKPILSSILVCVATALYVRRTGRD